MTHTSPACAESSAIQPAACAATIVPRRSKRSTGTTLKSKGSISAGDAATSPQRRTSAAMAARLLMLRPLARWRSIRKRGSAGACRKRCSSAMPTAALLAAIIAISPATIFTRRFLVAPRRLPTSRPCAAPATRGRVHARREQSPDLDDIQARSAHTDAQVGDGAACRQGERRRVRHLRVETDDGG